MQFRGFFEKCGINCMQHSIPFRNLPKGITVAFEAVAKDNLFLFGKKT